MKRPDGRRADEMRPVQIIKDFTMHAEGSVLIACGNTKVICNATVEERSRLSSRIPGLAG